VNLKDLVTLYSESSRFKTMAGKLSLTSPVKLRLTGLVGSVDAVLASTFYNVKPQTNVFVFNDIDEARYFQADVENLLEGKTVLFFPSSYRRPFQISGIDNGLVLERAEVLNRLNQHSQNGELVVTTAEAIAELVIAEKELTANTYELKVGHTFDLEFFIEFLTEHHFERSDFVYEAGQFSIRGGIVDVFSYSNDMPYRLELDGEVIESIRTFDPNTQLSVKKVDRFFIIPNVQKGIDDSSRQHFFTYLPANTIFWAKDVNLCLEQIEKGREKAQTIFEKFEPMPEQDTLQPIDTIYANEKLIIDQLKKYKVVEWGTRFHFKPEETIQFNTTPQPLFHKNFKLLILNLKENQRADISNLIFSESSRQVERLYTIFDDLDREVEFHPIYHGISKGFVDKELKLACYTEHQVFDRFYKGHVKNAYSKSRIITLKELKDLKPGDFVTHIDHGVGKFAGLEKIDVNGHTQEAVRLVYRDSDLLYVSINSLHKISKYVGKDGTEPRVNKLGSDAWEKLKTSTKKKVKDIARDLIKLYAKRKAQKGFEFAPDNYMQVELEASFMYEDTPDQSKATADVKKDMETDQPMDRLVCGDVGFGKTEVAIRAAFKAVCDSKQVAILVPTTILANQHYRTFKERLKDFPCTVDYINRFRSAAEQKATLQQVKEGKVDILIGTHKLLSKDIKYKDLGLLIVDEEQKFGVAAKEKLKAIKTNVDTLTLTATPIPRTLHFSLMGARDLSIINTPPANRQPVTTELHAYNDELLREIINNEIERGGQVFMVHHRVKDIYEIANRIMKICPGVKVGVAHGQLEGDKLEDVMIKFIEGDYDVLVATTIIESGLDIPNANTIIINNAQMFGLSDMHQMRGRVGRTNRKAFCYLMVPSMQMLTSEAKRRLQAIEEFSDLGSGFNVAMRDLDIRGAGNLLGGEQSGFISEIGFEMYHKILDEAIQELKEDEFTELFKDEQIHKLESKDCVIETDLEALIPDEYVRSVSERVSLYSELSRLETDEQLVQFGQQLKDRFGPIPQQVIDLFELIQLRTIAKKIGFEKLVLKNSALAAYFPDEKKQAYYQSELFSKVLRFVQHNSQRCKMKQTPKSLILGIQHVSGIGHAKSVLDDMVKAIG
jgi:transcription-repair coupling factor (superfamily II helicase)